jgi:excisionase family DNA binding protein
LARRVQREEQERSQERGASCLVDIRLVAERLGVSTRHVRRLVLERRIPFIKWGRLLRFDLAEVSRWVDEHRRDVRAHGGAESPGPR